MGFDTDETNWITTEMGVPDHSGLCGAHARPTLQGKMVLVHDRPHYFANVERLLASGVGLVSEDFAHRGETVATVSVGREPDVPIDGIGGHILARKALARHHVGVFIVAQENLTGVVDAAGPVLCLAVGTHNAIVAADAFVVL